jgi:hypothetical protein
MAISSGVGPHSAWLSINGGMFPIEHGTVEQTSTRKSATFSADIPLNWPGALGALASLGANTATIIVNGSPLIVGEIDSAEFDLITSTMIRVSGRDQGAKLHENKTAEKWTNKLGSDIATDLAGRVGLGVQADSSMLKAGKLVNIDFAKLTDGISYAAAIQKVAELDGARWWVKNGILNYQSQQNPAGTYPISYSAGPPIVSDALSLRIKKNIQAGKQLNVTVKSWHPKKKQVFTGQAQGGGANGGSLNYVYHIPSLDQDHVNQYAKAKAKAHSRHGTTIDAEVCGDPSIDVAMALVLSGTGYFDGQYLIDAVSHKFGMGGYTMTITAKLPGSDSGS